MMIPFIFPGTGDLVRWDIDPNNLRVTRVKKNQIDGELREEATVYGIGSKSLGEGGRCVVTSLIPINGQKKIKALKVKDKFSPKHVNLEQEFIIHSLLPKSEGLALPPKAFLGCAIVLVKYHCTLETILKQMTPEMKKEAIKQLVNGLSALHLAGIRHCDISRRNIMLRTKNNETRYDLIDFGESWIYDSNYIKFTFPENDKEQKFLIDQQSDIFRLGSIFHDIVLGGHSPNPLTEEIVTEKELPPNYAHLVNYMIDTKNKQKNMLDAQQIMNS